MLQKIKIKIGKKQFVIIYSKTFLSVYQVVDKYGAVELLLDLK